MFRAFLYRIKENKLSRLSDEEILHCELPAEEPPSSPLGETDSFLWLDVTDPTPEEVAHLAARFRLDPQILEDINSLEGRPKLHDYEDYIYVIFHDIKLETDPQGRRTVETAEIDCLLGPDWVLTIHDSELPSFDKLMTRWERRPEWMRGGPAQLLYELMDAVLDDYFPVLEKIDDHIDDFESRLLMNEQKRDDTSSLSGEIFALKRILLEIRHIAGPTRDVSNILLRRDAEEGGKHFAAFQDLYDHASRIVSNIDTYRDILSGALDAYLAIESNKMNAIMKQLTAYSIILLVPTLIAGVFGMNFDDLPKHHGFWASMLTMGAAIIGLAAYFKQRRWL